MIEGVSTNTTAFVGPTRSGPSDGVPHMLASLAEFERIYGDGQPLEFNGVRVDNYLWHGTRAFFAEGGRKLYVKRIQAKGHLVDAFRMGLASLEDLDDVSIVAAPGCMDVAASEPDAARSIIDAVIAHAERMRYRFAVIDAGKGMTVEQVSRLRALFDSSRAALYYPWISILDPITKRPSTMPPSGFVAGIYARSDTTRGVSKAPANDVVTLAIGLERMLNQAEQEPLNAAGVNCFRFFEGRGFRLWGARTMSTDPEWKYVNLRRYVAYLEHSIEKGTQWAVFEPNGPTLWANVRQAAEQFLVSEWRSGALMGDRPEKAFFVKCDQTTMTQNDIDNGRLVCLVGVAPVRPAEFVIFRIGQWTKDAGK